MTKRAALTISAALAAVAVAPSPASAAKSFAGKTQQDRPVTVRVGDDGIVSLVRITWRTRRCRSGEFLQDRTDFRAPFDSATVDAFADRGAYSLRQRGGYRIRVTIDLTGKRIVDPANPAAERWQGTLRSTAVVRRNGRTVDRCSLRSIGWTATPTA